MTPPRPLELLAPAGNADIAIQAILHGADAVYMGASSHGARRNAANSIDDIRRTVDFAHTFRARVYVTVNTIIYDHELAKVESLIRDLYHAGVDAIIVQDMSILRMDIPPIELHASTQCDIRTPQKARFLQDVGFSQLVLPRELTLDEIRDIREAVDIPVECFVHGALCVSYSGRCHASQAVCGRSANRGECAQICRLPYTLRDADGRILAKDKHLLSLRDLNTSHMLRQLVEAGASSFKIEGRLKEAGYVKNVTASYRKKLDDIIDSAPDLYRRSSFGRPEIGFDPELSKSFNRGFSTYFLQSRRPDSLTSPDTPKSLGEPIADVSRLNNGDGISFFDAAGRYAGDLVNGVDHDRILTAKLTPIPKDAKIFRTYDRLWEKKMGQQTASRKIDVSISIDSKGITASDERGCMVRIPLDTDTEIAKTPQDYRRIFEKLGNTPYRLAGFASDIQQDVFIPAARLTDLRRQAVAALDEVNRTTYRFAMRRKEDMKAKYMTDKLDFRDNVSNSLARLFYSEHGVKSIRPALEITKTHAGMRVMTTRHCILRELGMCRKEKGSRHPAEPLTISSGKDSFTLEFNCRDCEMHLILRSPNDKR